MLFDNCPFFFIMSEVGAKTYTEVVYLVSLLLFPESKAKQCLYCCFLFNFTSSNMSKNLSQYLLKGNLHDILLLSENGGRVENNGFEPLTPCVQGRCSSQLS